ncbi:MAG: hypothetical protein CVV13_07190 [Gammaproteobacteria bacterium HGW-Gammaproteobacteria-3]|nr:MAG: hypothetical protein CVV13_07190 [Gammaproteobacteria bacterium HGW-Gammaproteobacteria-3]
MTLAKHSLRVLALASLQFIPVLAGATNGYFAHGYGARSKAMAGAGAALPQDAVASAVNPAGLVRVGDRLDVELELFSPRRNFTVSGEPTLAPGAFPLNPGNFDSNEEYFPIPTLGWSKQLSDTQAVGVALYGNGGMYTEFSPKANPICPPGSEGRGVFCAGRTGVDLAQVFIVPSFAQSFADGRFSVGVAPILAAQYFKARGFGSFAPFSADPAQLSEQGRDYSFGGGFRVGVLAEPLQGLRFGVSYKSRIWMSKFNEYSGLFAEQGDFDIPDSYNIGVSWDISSRFTAAFDVEHIRYSEIKSVGNRLLPNLQQARLGDKNGAGFGWQDMTVYKLGLLWKPDDLWTLRGGVSYGDQPIPSSEVLFNITAPGVQQWHLTTGFSRKLWDSDEVSFAFMYSPKKSVKGVNPLSPGQTIELEMYQLSWQLAWSRSF